MSLSIHRLMEELNQFEERVPLDVLTQRLAALEVNCDDVRDFIEFDDDRYRRNLMYAGQGFQALILCWKNGQRSPIHDHEGSTCGVRVLKGVMTETVFDRTHEGRLIAMRSRELREGGVCGSQDADIHQVSNLQPNGAELITLHIYSPALESMNTYSLTDGSVSRFKDPIYEFSHGAGI